MTTQRTEHTRRAPDAADIADVADERDKRDARLTAALLRALAPAGEVSVRRLGGLRGLFHPAAGDTPFGIVSRGEVFFKAGPDAVTKYIARGMRPLRLSGERQPLSGYWQVPPDVLDSADTVVLWAARAVDAARQFGRRRRAKLKRRMRGGGA
jgi:TfoX/Sxy family transcriptional regulator of competence genes